MLGTQTRRSKCSWAIALLLGMTLGPAREAAWAQGPPATPVRFTEARQHQVRRSIALSGSVESRRISVVASEVEGVVERLVAREGDLVAKGDPLVKLRKTTIQLRLQAVRGSTLR